MPSRNQGFVITYQAYNTNTGAYTTGDAANHTLRLIKDGTEAAPTNGNSEVDATNMPGFYSVALTSAETNFNVVTIGGKSSTANVILIPLTVGFENLPIVLSQSSGVNVSQIAAAQAATSLAAGNVNVVSWLGTAVTAAAAGIPDVNAKNIANAAAATSLAAGNVNVVSFNGTTTATSLAAGNVNVVGWLGTAVTAAAAGIPDVNTKNIANAAAATSLAASNVNVVSFNGTSTATSLALGNVNVVDWLGTAPAPLVNALVQAQVSGTPGVNVTQIAGAAVATGTAQIGVNVVNWNAVPVLGSLPPDAIFTPGQSSVTLQSGSSGTTVTLVSGSSNVTDFYKWQTIALKSGLGIGESATIVNYNAATKVATINGTWAQNPSGGDGYFLIANGQVSAVAAISGIANVNVQQWSGGAVPAPNITGTPLVDVNQWRGTQPNTLVSNRVDSSVGNLAAGVIVNTSFGTGALTTVVFATNAFTSAVFDITAENAIADALLDRSAAIETGVTPRQAIRYIAAAEAGVTAGALTSTFTVAAIANNGTNRITATTTASGNRTAVTLN